MPPENAYGIAMRRSADECVPSGFAEKRERRGRLPFAVRLNRESVLFLRASRFGRDSPFAAGV